MLSGSVFWFMISREAADIWPVVTDTPGHIRCQGRVNNLKVLEVERLSVHTGCGEVKESLVALRIAQKRLT